MSDKSKATIEAAIESTAPIEEMVATIAEAVEAAAPVILTDEMRAYDVALYLVPDGGIVRPQPIVPNATTALPADEGERTETTFEAINASGQRVNFDKYLLDAETFIAWWNESDPAKRTALLLPHLSDSHPAAQRPINRKVDATMAAFPFAVEDDVWSRGILALASDAAKRSGSTRSGDKASKAQTAVASLMARKAAILAAKNAANDAAIVSDGPTVASPESANPADGGAVE